MVYEKDIEDTKGIIEGQTGNKTTNNNMPNRKTVTNGHILVNKTLHRKLEIKQRKPNYISKSLIRLNMFGFVSLV